VAAIATAFVPVVVFGDVRARVPAVVLFVVLLMTSTVAVRVSPCRVVWVL
jgi:hypothetical protein